jgi:hypothetical protein
MRHGPTATALGAERGLSARHAFFTNSDLSPIAPIPSILQSMS